MEVCVCVSVLSLSHFAPASREADNDKDACAACLSLHGTGQIARSALITSKQRSSASAG